MSAPLLGLLLTGGHGKRMQQDKALLNYAGQSQLERAVALITPFVSQVYLSVRSDQLQQPARARYACIADRLPDLGPLGGIHAALHAQVDAAWLVLACDLPFLDAATVQQLIAARRPQSLATAYRSSHDGLPEPLCAIWEPQARSAVDAWIGAGKKCPRALLAESPVTLLTLAKADALDNINTREEYASASAQLSATAATTSGGATRRIQVQYFALLRDQAGRSREEVHTGAPTARALYLELQQRHRLSLTPELLRVAINDDFADWQQALRDGDRVVFLPPVAGG